MRILHLHSSFDPGGKELRAARLMSLFGRGLSHTVVSAQPGALGARQAVDRAIPVDYPDSFPPLAGRPGLGRLQRIAQAMRGHDLVLTYNWGAMDAVMAHTLFARAFALPPLVHHEDGFNQDEAAGLKPLRNWYRRIALGQSAALVVPSERLERIALEVWQQPRGRVHRIVNGIATAAYARKPRPDTLPRVVKRPGEFWVGTLAGLRAVKNLPRLVRACAALPEAWHLVIVGEGPEREAIRAEALRLGIGHRLHLPGFVPDPASVVGLFDLFALSSDSEQFPISVVEAMAAGLPVVSPAVGDVAGMVAAENRPFVVDPGNEAALAAALATLAADAPRREAIGRANRARAVADYDEAAMVAAYRAVYGAALGTGRFP
ncbi:glycosyltransferase family 4 protein [Novosphingobium piscinae]|uniref:Glycosyltransferase family 4 protein n=1 Tax=Novosphingobium piscinae TaxID=1507448 RepID=A0A7X1G0H1_9SPHN|nr:glycosyltransferase family 4 protein [Novosphingobium piscinae]MBC2670413.1 glycosyltransferase family 4 protein [Novosphingobium piscinae]